MALVLRPLSMGELVDQPFSLYRDHFKIFVGIFLFPQIAVMVMNFGMQVIMHAGSSSPSAAAIAGVIYVPIYVATWLIAYCVGLAATVYAVSQFYLDRPTTIGQSYSFIKRRFWSILAVGILVFLAAIVGCIIGLFALFVGSIVALVLILLYSSLAIPVTVLEGRDPIESIKRSYNLVKDDLGRILVIGLLFLVVQIGVGSLVSVPVFIFALLLAQHGQVPLWFNALSDLGSLVVGSIVGPLLTIALSIAYYDERIRKEAFDMQFMMAAIDRNVMSAGTAAVAANSALPSSL